MTPGMLKMYISFFGIGFMFLSVVLIYLSRYKLKGIFKMITAVIAYILMILAGLIIFFVVFSGPVAD
ncbi:Protein of unknown function (DUF2768) [Schinkia azotoformans MEV2011]|jgi:hypothetical protein|uniref:DUF2768 domain-containing protein n=2 Tax=Schinkia azotoformans TaxID=1454 RepID=K6D4C9_SCHAZ|nr:DUF2768 domain-containing protein [Schinkia azotoformans]EKN67362.1 hypothetical protein BAZO_09376 [Schinkia azotoformans LMG 9581]KEF40553.1 Protein of unknown function (DUF2768) [Schinkia azotoformans MEV2011]MEC1639385.1 DUF2768 domain-containing protein [Schinkia azotoformans]MEC1696041.1 DUF2768 domain-containing protein [Schinkia azotoformans]MEC1716745.1 DUF2768 domain-containing protein [Schinkia azotoformans]